MQSSNSRLVFFPEHRYQGNNFFLAPSFKNLFSTVQINQRLKGGFRLHDLHGRFILFTEWLDWMNSQNVLVKMPVFHPRSYYYTSESNIRSICPQQTFKIVSMESALSTRCRPSSGNNPTTRRTLSQRICQICCVGAW